MKAFKLLKCFFGKHELSAPDEYGKEYCKHCGYWIMRINAVYVGGGEGTDAEEPLPNNVVPFKRKEDKE